MTRNPLLALLASSSMLAACATAPRPAAVAPAAPALVEPAGPAPAAPVSALVQEVAIPHSTFQLDNGLTVMVHEDHKAPVVAVSVWYNVGSKDEPKGKTGFAHLFEHLMFNGSENAPKDFDNYLQEIGATDSNGTTWYDRTNYFQTVPKAAIDRALFLESDRMGYLLGAVTQQKLDTQRGVVQNEKRQRDNNPGGLVFYAVSDNLFPEGHPYRHSTIGSMADLDAASLADVKRWFIDNYGPNNAILVLAGDITEAEARPLAEKYFGAIKRGPVNVPANADIPSLAASKALAMKDRVAAVQIQRNWTVPGIASDQLAALDLGGEILGGLASSRLDKVLVRDEQIAVSVSAGLQAFQRLGFFSMNATVKPGVDPALVERRLDEMLAQFIAEGPTAEEVQRAATSTVAGRIRGLEQVGGFGGKAVALAEGKLYTGDSNFYRRSLDQYASVTPAAIRAAMGQWLARPSVNVRLEPGDRPPYEEAKIAARKRKSADIKTVSTKREVPPLGPPVPLDFPDVQHVQLSNGVKVHYAQRTAVPLTQLALSFDAGFAADPANARGLQNLTLGLLDEGAAGMTSQQIAEEEERLGASIGAAGSADRSSVQLSALSANLAPSLDLLADIVRRPDFNPEDLARVRTQTLTSIAQAQKNPSSIAARILPIALYGENHPYGTTSLGLPAAVEGFTRDDIARFHQTWLRPDNLEIFIVSSLPLAEVQPLLEQRFGRWETPAVAKGSKSFATAPVRPNAERIILVDRPDSPQSVILGGQITPLDPRADLVAASGANEVLGGNFLSRINSELRENKGWSYGSYGFLQMTVHAVPYIVQAPVQADRTGDSIRALSQQIRGFLGGSGVTEDELGRIVAKNVNELPGQFETSAAVLSAMQTNAMFGRPDNYYELLGDKYRSQTRTSLDASLRQAIDPAGFVWVVVGDAKKVRPQLEKLGLPIEVVEAR